MREQVICLVFIIILFLWLQGKQVKLVALLKDASPIVMQKLLTCEPRWRLMLQLAMTFWQQLTRKEQLTMEKGTLRNIQI